jgi:hypothetical protein
MRVKDSQRLFPVARNHHVIPQASEGFVGDVAQALVVFG